MYTQDFINKVKELFPDNIEMHRLATKGSTNLGRYLDESVCLGVKFETVFAAASLEELQAKARIAKRKSDLYGEWLQDYLPVVLI